MTAQSGLGFSGIVAINIPDDGATGEVLTKQSPDNYDYDWDPGSAGPTVDPGTIDNTILRWNGATPAWEEFTGYILPLADGSDGQAIITDGAGTLTFGTVSGGGALSGQYRFSTIIVAADPGPGRFRYDAVAYGAVTQIFIDDFTSQGVDISNLLALITTGDRMYIQAEDDSNEFAVWDVTAPITDNTGWFTIDVSLVANGDLLSNNDRTLIILQIGGALVTLQISYDNASAVPQIIVNATPDPLTIDASVAGDIFAIRDAGNVDKFRADDLGLNFGQTTRRIQRMEQVDATGRFGTELWPDDFTISTATGVGAAFYTDAARIITLNIPGGGGLGNETAPAGMNFTHTVRFEDQGFVFASQLLINAAVKVECAANVGPLYLFLDQYQTFADGGAFTCSQHNTIRAQPRWGPNINGGSITQTSAILFLAFCSVDGTVGSSSITNMTYFNALNPSLVAGGTIGTFNAFDIANISGPTTIRGINSAMANGTFINHTGVANSIFAGPITLNNAVELRLGGATANDVVLTRSAVDTMQWTATGILSWDLNTAVLNAMRAFSVGDGLQFDFPAIVFGTTSADPTANWQALFAPGAKTVTIGGDFSRRLFSASAGVTLDAAMSNAFTDTINEPFLIIGTGSVVNAGNVLIQTAPGVGTNRYGLLITSNPSGGTLNYAFRQSNAAALARFDGRLDINRGIALGGGAAATLGTIGGAGPTAAAQAQWLEIDIGGVAHWLPVWV